MKQTIAILLFSVFCVGALQANIKPSQSVINSLSFTNTGWSVTISRCMYQGSSYKNSVIDSIVFSNRTEQSNLKQLVIEHLVSIASYYTSHDFTADSLEKAITLKQTGDILRVHIYGHYETGKWAYKDSILWGDEPGACVRAPKDGESLASQQYYGSNCGFSVCGNTCFATLKGRIFDKNGELLCNKTFDGLIPQSSFTTDASGNYMITVYSGSSTTVSNLIQSEPSYLKDPTIKDYHSFSVEPITYNANPGEAIVRDLHLTTAYVSVREQQKVLSQFICMPNPARESIAFNYTIDQTVSLANLFIYVYDVSGKMMDKLTVSTLEGTVLHSLDSRYKAGSYSYVVRSGEQEIYRGQFFVQ